MLHKCLKTITCTRQIHVVEFLQMISVIKVWIQKLVWRVFMLKECIVMNIYKQKTFLIYMHVQWCTTTTITCTICLELMV